MNRPSDPTTSLWELVEEAANTRPDDVLLNDDNGRALTRSQFHTEAERVATGFYDMGLRPRDVVSWQLPTTLEAAVLMAALSRLGAVQNPIIPVFRQREVGFIINDVASQLLVVPEEWRGFSYGEMARALPVEVVTIDLDQPPSAGLRLPTGAGPPPLEPPVDALACRWVYYSSGTTAEAKGARHCDATLIASSNGVVHGLGMHDGDVYPIAWPFAHIGGVAMLVSVLRAGGTLVLFDSFDPVVTPARMADHHPTILGSAAPFFTAYIAAQRMQGERPMFPHLRACVGGGAATPEVINREIATVLGIPGVVGAWGLTEFPVATSETPQDPAVGSTVGRPVEGVTVRVVDRELRLKGPQCFLGYVDEKLNEAAFDDEGWFRTGDLGSVDADGRVRIEGRSKDVIIRKAENISSLEVEEVLLRHASVADVAIVGIPDERTGERICAVVVATPGAIVTVENLAEHCQAEGLARYKCPERLQLIDILPRTPMGKVLKRSLPVDGLAILE